MTKKLLFALICYFVGVLLLTGCSTEVYKNKKVQVTSSEYIVQGAFFEDDQFFEFHNGALQKTETHCFSSYVELDGTKYQIEFLWSISNGELHYNIVDGGLPGDLILDEIEGCTTALKLYYEIDIHSYRYLLCGLTNSTITPIFDDVLSKYVVNDITLSDDLKTMIFLVNGNEKVYYYDGQKVYDLAELCGINVDKEFGFRASFYDNYIVVYVGEFVNRKGATASYYFVDLLDMSAHPGILNVPRYVSNGEQPNGIISDYGLYGYRQNYAGYMEIVDLQNGNTVTTDMSLTDKTILDYYNGYLFISDSDSVYIMCLETGEIIYTLTTEFDLNETMDWQLVKDGDNYYMLLSKDPSGYLAYKLDIEI